MGSILSKIVKYFQYRNTIACLCPVDSNTTSAGSEFTPIPNPEPTTFLLLGTGLIGIAVVHKKFKKKQP
jgi:hypothetical protein